MGFLIAILTIVLLGLVILVVGAPLRRARQAGHARRAHAPEGQAPPGGVPPVEVPQGEASSGNDGSARLGEMTTRARTQALDELEAAREAKYREIRDAELDYRTGKLSREDYEAIDAELRVEAIEILDRLELLKPRDA